MADIEYFYAAHSAYAYLGSRKLLDIVRAGGHRLVHRPVDLAQVIEGAGSTPTRTRSAAFRAYFFGREIRRWSEERGAPVTDGIPTHHFNDVGLANRMLIAAMDGGASIDDLSHSFLQAHWRDDADLADVDTLCGLVQAAGLDAGTVLTGARSDATRARYEAFTREAIERSVFGSPTYFVAGDMFYGQDRLEMVKRALTRPYRA
jgi:2-hydroxychromene-2-carboxylate isomerase